MCVKFFFFISLNKLAYLIGGSCVNTIDQRKIHSVTMIYEI